MNVEDSLIFIANFSANDSRIQDENKVLIEIGLKNILNSNDSCLYLPNNWEIESKNKQVILKTKI